MRTDDIKGASYKKFYSGKYGKKTTNFFPNVPEVNEYYNSMKSRGMNVFS